MVPNFSKLHERSPSFIIGMLGDCPNNQLDMHHPVACFRNATFFLIQ